MAERVIRNTAFPRSMSGVIDRRSLLRFGATLGVGGAAAFYSGSVFAQEDSAGAPVLVDQVDPDSLRNEKGTIEGSQVVVALPGDPGTLDPQFELSGNIGNALNPMFHHLLDYDREFSLHPEAAESVELLEEGRVFRFRLKEGIRFWNGEPLNAEAVKFTYDRTKDEDLRSQGLSLPVPDRQGFQEARIVDELTVDLVFEEYRSNIMVLFPQVFIIAPGYYSEKSPEETARQPMGSGPYMFKEWVKDDHLTMVANPDYYLGPPQIETLIYRAVPERSTRMALLESGEADLITEISPDDLPLVEANDDLRVVNTPTMTMAHVQIPMRTARYQDKRVRKALAMAVDYESIREHILNGLTGDRLAVPTPGEFWTNPAIKPVEYDPEGAQALLQEADFPFSDEITLYTAAGDFTNNEAIASAIASNFREIGLNCSVQVLEASIATQRARAREFDDLYLNIHGSRNFAPDDLNLINQYSAYDNSHWLEFSPQADKFLELSDLAQTAREESDQREYVFEAHEIFMDEAPWILLHRDIALYGVNKRIDWTPTSYTRIHPWIVGEEGVQFVE